MKFWRNAEIEDLTANRLAEFERKADRKHEPPVPVELLAEMRFDLKFCYEAINGLPGHKVWACFSPGTRTIYVNENHRALFTERPGLERFSVGHEIGHWDLFEKDRDSATGLMFGCTDPDGRLDFRTASGVPVKFIRGLWQDNGTHDVLAYVASKTDSPSVASAVNRYASALLMPKDLVLAGFNNCDITSWTNLYSVARTFGVTISALVVRLQRLGQIHVTKDKRIFKGTEAEYAGQTKLF